MPDFLPPLPLFTSAPISEPPKRPNSHRQLHLQNVLALLHLSLLRQDYPRARRAWKILATCREAGWEGIYRFEGALRRGLDEEEEEGEGKEREEWLEGLRRGGGREVSFNFPSFPSLPTLLLPWTQNANFHVLPRGRPVFTDEPTFLSFLLSALLPSLRSKVIPLLQTYVYHLLALNPPQPTRALDTLEIYITSIPYAASPALHGLAALCALGKSLETTEGGGGSSLPSLRRVSSSSFPSSSHCFCFLLSLFSIVLRTTTNLRPLHRQTLYPLSSGSPP